MKKLALGVLSIVLIFSAIGCSCTVEKKAVSDIEATHKIVLPQYVKYVEADGNLDNDQKDDRKKLVGSLQRLVGSLKKSVED